VGYTAQPTGYCLNCQQLQRQFYLPKIIFSKDIWLRMAFSVPASWTVYVTDIFDILSTYRLIHCHGILWYVTSLRTVKADVLQSSIFRGGLFFALVYFLRCSIVCGGLFLAMVYFLRWSIFCGGLFLCGSLFLAVVYFCGGLFWRWFFFCGGLFLAIFTHWRLCGYHNKQYGAICT